MGKCSSGKAVVRINTHYYRPVEVETLVDDTSKSMEHLGWTQTTTLEELAPEMLPANEGESEKEASFCDKALKVLESSPSDFVKPTLVLGYGEAKE